MSEAAPTVGAMDIAGWGESVALWWNGDGWKRISEWMKSAGFAGFAAVMAATLAFAGARHQARLNAWWQRIEWAMNLYTGSQSSQNERIEARTGRQVASEAERRLAAAIRMRADKRLKVETPDWIRKLAQAS